MKTITFSKRVFIVVLFMTASAALWSQTIIKKQDFDSENSLAIFSTYGKGITCSGLSSITDAPSNKSFSISGNAFGLSASTLNVQDTSIIVFENQTGLDAITDPNKFYSFRLASWSIGSTTNGADGTDSVKVAISLDGGTTWSRELAIKGVTNGRWSYESTGTAVIRYDGNNTPTIFKTGPGSGDKIADGYSTVKILLPSNCTQAQLRITMLNNDPAEKWTIDDVVLGSELSTPKVNQSILVAPLASKQIGDASFSLAGSYATSSALTATVTSSNPKVATVVGTTVSIVGGGETYFTFKQTGNEFYNAAKDSIVKLTVIPAITILAWDLSTLATTSPLTATTPSTFAPTNISASTLSKGAGLLDVTANQSFNAKGWNSLADITLNNKDAAVRSGDYFEFDVQSNNTLSLYNINYSLYRNVATAPTTFIWKYSIDNGVTFTEIGTEGTYTATDLNGSAQTAIDLSSIAELQNLPSSQKVIFRLYAWGAQYITTGVNYFGFGKSLTSGAYALSVRGNLGTNTAVEVVNEELNFYVKGRQLIVKSEMPFKVYNTWGTLVLDSKTNSANSSISLNPGIYIVKTASCTQKIMIQ